MAVAVSDAAALKIAASIEKLIVSNEKQYAIINSFLVQNLTPAGATAPNTPIAVLRAQALAINDMAVLMAEMIDQQKKLTSTVKVLQSAMGSVSANIAAGVTTQQLVAADQIKNNQFQQQTTNAALVRAELPPTVVQPTAIRASIESAVTDTLVVKSQVKASALVEEQITSAVSWTQTTVTNIVADSFIGSAATSAWTTLKGWLNITEPPVKETVAEGKAKVRGTLLADPGVIPPDGP